LQIGADNHRLYGDRNALGGPHRSGYVVRASEIMNPDRHRAVMIEGVMPGLELSEQPVGPYIELQDSPFFWPHFRRCNSTMDSTPPYFARMRFRV
jgi:hypothetical protein